MPKQLYTKRDGVINPQNNNFNIIRFETRKTFMLSKHYESIEVERIYRTWLHVHSGTYGHCPPASRLAQKLKCRKRLLLR